VATVEKNEEFTQKFYRETNWKAEDMEGQHVYLGTITCADERKMAPGADLVLLAPNLQLTLQHYWTHLLLTLSDKLSHGIMDH
jgi:hypothetical protein